MARRPPSSNTVRPEALRDGGLLAGRSVAIRERVAHRPPEGRDGEVVLVGVAVRDHHARVRDRGGDHPRRALGGDPRLEQRARRRRSATSSGTLAGT